MNRGLKIVSQLNKYDKNKKKMGTSFPYLLKKQSFLLQSLYPQEFLFPIEETCCAFIANKMHKQQENGWEINKG